MVARATYVQAGSARAVTACPSSASDRMPVRRIPPCRPAPAAVCQCIAPHPTPPPRAPAHCRCALANWKSEPIVSMMSLPRVTLASARHCATNASTLQGWAMKQAAAVRAHASFLMHACTSDSLSPSACLPPQPQRLQRRPCQPAAPLLHIVLVQARVVHDGRRGPLVGKALGRAIIAWRAGTGKREVGRWAHEDERQAWALT